MNLKNKTVVSKGNKTPTEKRFHSFSRIGKFDLCAKAKFTSIITKHIK